MRRSAARWAVGAAVAALVATGCGGGDGGGATDGSGVLSASWTDPQNPLEPANTNEVQGGKVLDMIFRGLKKYNPRTAAAENVIADSIETTDQRTFKVRLKDGWTFGNGEKVTSASFVDAWNYAALVTNKQVNASFFRYVEGYDKVHPESGKPVAQKLSGLTRQDDLNFTVELNQKFSTWPDTLGYAAFMPLPRVFFTDHAAWLRKPVGNGPYRVESYTKGQGMQLRAWDGYKGGDAAVNGGVDLKVYTDNNTAYTDLQAGNLDLVDDVPAAQLKNVRADLDGRYLNTPAGIIQTLAFPLYDKAWSGEDSEKLRQGISMAINRKQITRQIFQNTRIPARDWTSPVLGAEGGFDDTLCGRVCEYDPARARQLVKEGGGLPGGTMRITYNADSGSHRDWVDAVCNSINNALGKDDACVGDPVGTFADFRNQIVGRQMKNPFRAGWQMDYPLIQNFLQPLYYTGASSNDAHFSDPRFDRLIDRANAESDRAKAVDTFKQAERILPQQVPAIALWYQNGSAGWSQRLSRVALNPFSVPVFNQIKVG
ncbi:ABC transporter substrate-binding protein [Actinacidiphila glaucinigra]|uniref:peptide ABC transporter substrate-binding protein n=1 Tax=Actinacidiphila glaucinigra TaxID=235986 RepID=UPI002DD81630|nr:ABC transporter substrate-binding protein [Actinacidiphila glaucinigra]WSD60328.1 ABC transporter substrate-binding protein [Actinacidiphila glaucinigra]